MQYSVPSYILAGFLLLSGACACKYKERDGQIQVALDALTFPVTDGKDPKLECATTAAAFGLTSAALSALLFSTVLVIVSASYARMRNAPAAYIISSPHKEAGLRTKMTYI